MPAPDSLVSMELIACKLHGLWFSGPSLSDQLVLQHSGDWDLDLFPKHCTGNFLPHAVVSGGAPEQVCGAPEGCSLASGLMWLIKVLGAVASMSSSLLPFLPWNESMKSPCDFCLLYAVKAALTD